MEAVSPRFDDHGLIPAIIQDWRDGAVLMLGYMNDEALTRTVQSGRVHFWSRSRQRLWEKGETSGHRLLVRSLWIDCDQDAVLVKVEPTGPTCHTGEPSCFFSTLAAGGHTEKASGPLGGVLDHVYRTIASRKEHPTPNSYVSTLFQRGLDQVLKKVSEEAGEVVLASKNGNADEIIYEVADLWFHTLVVLGYHAVSPGAVYRELARRAQHGGSPGVGGADKGAG